jgi:hypothetical protein
MNKFIKFICFLTRNNLRGKLKMAEKTYYCIECNREIKHKGKCLACNVKNKKRREAQDKKY